MKYHYVLKNRETGKIFDFKIYNVDKSEEEMNDICEKFNNNPDAIGFHERVTSEREIEMIELSLQWKTDKTISDIEERLQEISIEVSTINYDIKSYFEIKKEQFNEVMKNDASI